MRSAERPGPGIGLSSGTTSYNYLVNASSGGYRYNATKCFLIVRTSHPNIHPILHPMIFPIMHTHTQLYTQTYTQLYIQSYPQIYTQLSAQLCTQSYPKYNTSYTRTCAFTYTQLLLAPQCAFNYTRTYTRNSKPNPTPKYMSKRTPNHQKINTPNYAHAYALSYKPKYTANYTTNYIYIYIISIYRKTIYNGMCVCEKASYEHELLRTAV